jgi:hypothetical protein
MTDPVLRTDLLLRTCGLLDRAAFLFALEICIALWRRP